jgi:hypothetical protein
MRENELGRRHGEFMEHTYAIPAVKVQLFELIPTEMGEPSLPDRQIGRMVPGTLYLYLGEPIIGFMPDDDPDSLTMINLESGRMSASHRGDGKLREAVIGIGEIEVDCSRVCQESQFSLMRLINSYPNLFARGDFQLNSTGMN